MEKELLELKNKMKNVDVKQFKNYNEYIKYCCNLTLEFLKKYNLSTNELNKLLEKFM